MYSSSYGQVVQSRLTKGRRLTPFDMAKSMLFHISDIKKQAFKACPIAADKLCQLLCLQMTVQLKKPHRPVCSDSGLGRVQRELHLLHGAQAWQGDRDSVNSMPLHYSSK